MEITYPSKLNDAISPISNCLSPTSDLTSQFYQSVAFSPPSSSDDFNSRHVFSSNQTSNKSITTPLVASSPTTNIIFSLTQTANPFNYFNHQQPRHDQQTIVETSNTTSSSNATTTAHVLCR